MPKIAWIRPNGTIANVTDRAPRSLPHRPAFNPVGLSYALVPEGLNVEPNKRWIYRNGYFSDKATPLATHEQRQLRNRAFMAMMPKFGHGPPDKQKKPKPDHIKDKDNKGGPP